MCASRLGIYVATVIAAACCCSYKAAGSGQVAQPRPIPLVAFLLGRLLG